MVMYKRREWLWECLLQWFHCKYGDSGGSGRGEGVMFILVEDVVVIVVSPPWMAFVTKISL